MNSTQADKAIKDLQKVWNDARTVRRNILDIDNGTSFITDVTKSILDAMDEIRAARGLLKDYKYTLNYKPGNNE